MPVVIGPFVPPLVTLKTRCRVSRFGRQNTFLGGQDFCFYYTFETKFTRHNKIWEGTKNLGSALLPVASGLRTTLALTLV